MTQDRPAVLARGLRVVFGDVTALDGLDLVAPAGAVTAVLGPNGAGKTTFVRAVATLQPPGAGRLEILGIDAGRAPDRVRRVIGLAGQHAAVVEELTGRENLRLVARLYGLGRRRAAAAAEEVIDALSLGDFADRRVATYSGGQRRRLDVGVSMVGQPAVLLLDEPTAGLDPRSRDELWQLVLGLPAGGSSVLLTTQYLDEAAHLADHVVIVDHGRAIASGSPAELRRSTGTVSLIVTTDEAITPDRAAAAASSIEAELHHRGERLSLVGSFGFDDAAAALRRACIASRVTELSYRPPTLDDVFLSLTSSDEGSTP